MEELKKTVVWCQSEPPKSYIWVHDEVAYEWNNSTRKWEESQYNVADLIPLNKYTREIFFDDNTTPPDNMIWHKEGELLTNKGNGDVWKNESGSKAYDTQYLTFEMLENGTVGFTYTQASDTRSVPEKTIQYKINDGEWTSITSASTGNNNRFSVNKGDKIYFKGNNESYASDTYTNSFSTVNSAQTYPAKFNVSGNIMSLIYGDNFKNNNVFPENSSYNFSKLFSSSYVVDSSNLVLPATTLNPYCYYNMFENCTQLINAPVLPSTILATDCYNGMFLECFSLSTAPALPATTLAPGCYENMFLDCTSLTTAPELLAESFNTPDGVATGCYDGMFCGCTSLSYVKCLLQNDMLFGKVPILNNWLYNVSETGQFVGNPNSTWRQSPSAVPSGWTSNVIIEVFDVA